MAGNEIANLVIKLQAETASLRTDLNAARQLIAQNTSVMSRGFDGVRAAARQAGAAIGLLAGSLGIAGLAAYAKHVIDVAGGLGELADQLGVTTDGLQALQYQAIQSGASAETLEQGLAKLTRSIGDASEGNEQLIGRFRSLGVGILDANGKVRGTEAVFSDVAKAVMRIEDPAKRASAVVDLFGKTGQRLLPVLDEVSRSGLDPLKDKAREAGAVIEREIIDRFDALSDRAALASKGALVRAADVLDKIVQTINGLDSPKAAALGLLLGAGVGARVAGLPGAAFGAGAGLAAGAVFAPGPSAQTRLQSARDDEQKTIDAIYGERTGANRALIIAVLERDLAEIRAKREAIEKEVYAARTGGGAVRASAAPAGEVAASGGGVGMFPRSTRELQNQISGDQFIRSLAVQRDSIEQTAAAQLKLRLERERDIQVINGIITDLGPKYTKSQIDAAVAIQKQIDAITDLRRRQIDAGATAAAQAADRDKERAAAAEFRNLRSISAQKANEEAAATRAQIPLIASARIEWNKYTQQFEAVNDELEVYIRKQRIIAEGRVGPAEAERQARQSVSADKDARKALEQQNFEVQRLNNAYDFLGQMGENAFNRIGDAATAMALDGENAFSSMANVGRAILASLYSDFLKLSLLNPLKNMLFGGNAATLSSVGGLLGGLFQPSGNISNYFGSTGSYGQLGNASLSFGGPRAAGGRVSPGEAYLVGEHGPEPFVPDVAGRIYPTDMLAEAVGGGNGGNTYYIDARGADQAAIARLEQRLRAVDASVERRSLAAFVNDYARGGATSRLMRA